MHAVVQDGYGPPEVLALRKVAVPVPAADEVLVEVRAASLNAADWHIMAGEPYVARLALGLRRPTDTVQGRDLAGQVVAVGESVTTWQPGDEVFGRSGSGPRSGGAFAEFACAGAGHLVRKPAGIAFEQAAAVPLAGNTALQALRDVGGAAPGLRVLVNGASGGVGTFAVQIARILGAEVTAVCSARNIDLVRSLGAHDVIDYRTEDFTRRGDRFDVVLDLVANRSLAALRRTLTSDGTLVLVGGGSGRWLAAVPLMLAARALSPLVGHRLCWLDEAPSAANLALLAGWVASGQLTPVVDRVFPLSETPEAMRHLLEEHAQGKIVIVP